MQARHSDRKKYFNEQALTTRKYVIPYLQDLIEINENTSVLEIGCGEAGNLVPFLDMGCKRVVGIDISEGRIENGKLYHSDHPNYKNLELIAEDIYDILDENGLWHLEQSYMPMMLKNNSYDTICHEHLEYYSRDVLINLAEMIGFRLEYEEKNKANGGSVRFIFRKIRGSRKCSYLQATSETLEKQRKSFQRLSKHVETLKTRINALTKANARMAGLGASTKGNTLLQLLNLSQENLSHIAEVNPDKFGLVTPGTHIPIISEHESKRFDITHYLILPWHFEQTFVNKKREFGNSKLILPMPTFKMI